MWSENLPENQSSNNQEAQLVQADDVIDKLNLEKSKAEFQADSLALARDASQLASLYRQEMQGERAARLAKVMHLKEQNQIGATLIASFMTKTSRHVGAPLANLQEEVTKVEGFSTLFEYRIGQIDYKENCIVDVYSSNVVWKHWCPEFTTSLQAENSSLIIWLDFMKSGRVTNVELNNQVQLLSKALGAMGESGIGFVIAPNLISERRSGITEELRRGFLK